MSYFQTLSIHEKKKSQNQKPEFSQDVIVFT